MSTGAFSIDQLMELAGLSVSQAGLSVLKWDFNCRYCVFSGFTCPSVHAVSCLGPRLPRRLTLHSVQATTSEQRKTNLGSLWSGQ